MAIDLKGWLFHSSNFCFCIPVRAGFVLMTILTFLLSGAISILIWFEIFHASQFSTNERVAFYLTGIVESILFLASTIGFVGAVARKQLFVMLYTYFLYIHFFLNLIVGIYFLVVVREINRNKLVDYCSDLFANTSMESSCSGLMTVSQYVFIAIVAVLLLLELYGTLIAARYVHRLRMQKRQGRSRRLGYFHALSAPETLSSGHVRQASDNIELLHSQESNGDSRDPEGVVLDIGQTRYVPVSTHDRDFPLAPSPPLSPPYSSSDMASGRHIRALPPRPTVVASPETSNPPQEGTAELGGLPNPHGHTSHPRKARQRRSLEGEEEERSLHTVEVSTNAHAALMDHATYIEPRFSSAPPTPTFFSRSLR